MIEHAKKRLCDEHGIALITAVLMTLVVAAMGMGAAMVGMNAALIHRYSTTQSVLNAAADAGIEEARSRINGDIAIYPDTGYAVIEDGVDVTEADGTTVPGVKRWTYVGPSGVTSGQYGVFGSLVVVVEDEGGNKVIRRGEVAQESFAKYAYFTDIEPSNISFGGGDMLTGPVHTNDFLKIYSSGASFLGTVTTGKTVQGAQYGTFAQGYTEYAPRIEMPNTADLNKLRAQATAGGTAYVGNTSGGYGEATTRIEFVAIDLNNDGSVTGSNEGFIRVYQSNDWRWLTGDVPSDYGSNGLRNSEQCGHWHADGTFIVADDHPTNGPDSWQAALVSATRRCYLGGSDSIFGGFVPNDGTGSWLPWGGPVDPALAGRADAGFLHPINREMNPTFRGVIFVDGKVAISGVLRGQVTIAATGDITIADDMTYASDPGAGTCADLMGMFSGSDVIMADNTLNSPIRPRSNQNYRTYDDTKDEFVHGVVLALDVFTTENYWSGSQSAENCETTNHGRGCLYLNGGIIQRTRGAVGTISGSGGAGYVKRYSYDQCAGTTSPPYFPTTGHFNRGRLFEVDPVNFGIGEYWARLTANQ